MDLYGKYVSYIVFLHLFGYEFNENLALFSLQTQQGVESRFKHQIMFLAVLSYAQFV